LFSADVVDIVDVITVEIDDVSRLTFNIVVEQLLL